MKTCFKCNVCKPFEEFYAHPMMADGRLNKCKDCTKQDSRKTYDKIMSDPALTEKEHARLRNKENNRRSSGIGFIQRAARKSVKYALRRGTLSKQPCEVCGCKEVQAHHENYMKPLDVRWLCVEHHNELHVAKRAAQLNIKLEVS